MRKKLENILFVTHPFLGTFSVIVMFGLPWWIAYWPGTLQYDSCGQLLQYLGVAKMTGHHPLPVSMLMGVLLDVGRALLNSDNVGLFLYTGTQFIAQSLVLAYAFCVYKRIGAAVWIRWISLIYYAIFPLVPNWGISYGKDTGYYICFLLFTLVMIDAYWEKQGKVTWRQKILWIVSLVGLAAFRNDGRFVIVIAMMVLLVCRRKEWKTYLLGAGIALFFLVLVEEIYMPMRNIPSVSIREAMSVPLMQTAKYIELYSDEITSDEEQILLSVFEVDRLEEIAAAYDKEISDDVKALFKEYPEKEELMSYLHVWWAQLIKHPATYLQTYLEHCNGYFYPGKRCYDDIIGWFKILDSQSWTDEYLDIHFGIEDTYLRDRLESWAYLLYDTPIIGLFYHTGTHTWIMFGCLLYLCLKGRKRDLFVIIPGIAVLMICTVSPLNAGVRYFLPVMAASPIYIAFCNIKNGKQEKVEKT